MKLFKRIIAGIAAVAVALSLTACANISKMGDIDGTEIPAGVYLWYVHSAIQEANTEVDNLLSEMGTDSSKIENFSYFNYNVQDKPYSQYVEERAMELVKQYVAIERRFDELGLEITPEEKTEVRESAKELWNTEVTYYGYSMGYTYGENYEKVGISRSSYEAIQMILKKSNKLFDAYYDENGVTATDEQDIKTYYNDNYGRFQIIEVELTDAKGDKLETDEAKADMKALADKYLERILGGEDYEAVYSDHETFKEEQKKQAEADKDSESKDESSDESSDASSTDESSDVSSADESSDASTEESVEGRAVDSSTDASTDESGDASTDESSDASTDESGDASTDESEDTSEDEEGEEEEEEPDHERIVSKESTSPSEDAVKWMFELKTDEGGVREDDGVLYVVVRRDLLEREDWYDLYRSDILHLMKDDEYEDVLNEIAKDYPVNFSDAALNAYKPEKVRQ